MQYFRADLTRILNRPASLRLSLKREVPETYYWHELIDKKSTIPYIVIVLVYF